MSTTSPIRKEEDLQRFRNYYLEKGKMRNYLLIVVGLNTALRIGDVLSLQWKDVYDYKRRRFRAHLQVVEQKTGKTNQIALNDCVLHALRQCYNGQKADEYLFYSACHKNQPISRSQAWRIVRQAAEETGLRRQCQLSFFTQNIWLSCMETGRSASYADDDLQPFIVSDYKALFRDYTRRKR